MTFELAAVLIAGGAVLLVVVGMWLPPTLHHIVWRVRGKEVPPAPVSEDVLNEWAETWAQDQDSWLEPVRTGDRTAERTLRKSFTERGLLPAKAAIRKARRGKRGRAA
ncbi:hypothetical protein [Nonomuraea soli]|uniref:Uncharacterized protein n=1 Tax=Nonomuraea soli TaxID=1032476 RepID=A0A7W0CUG0_9ACTN|nr:hypothetical protein [Nonomuraea soli]MBA2897365.1 hypothetical protein [Nonomuraea soli]